MCDEKEEENELAIRVLDMNYSLNEAEANQILETPRKVIRETNTFSDISLTRSERIKHAAKILNLRR